MAKSIKIIDYNRRVYRKCNNGFEKCPLVEKSEGECNRKISFTLQLLYSGLALCVFGYDIKADKTYFISLLLFAAPLFFEYFFYRSNEKINDIIYFFQKATFFIGMCLGGLGGLTEILSISIIDNSTCIKVSEKFFILKGVIFNVDWIMIPLVISIFLIFTHIFSLESIYEKNAANNNQTASA